MKGDSQTFPGQGESPPSYSASEEEEEAHDDNSLPSGREVEARNRERERERRRPPRIDAERANRSGSGSESEIERLPSAKRLGRQGSDSSNESPGAGAGRAY